LATLGAAGAALGFILAGGTGAAIVLVVAIGAVYVLAFEGFARWWERWFSHRR
jgi:hypothetical protein